MPRVGSDVLRMSLVGYQMERQRIDQKIAEVKSLLDGYPPTALRKRQKRKLSAEGRARIVAALKKRWAEKRKSAAKPKKKMSAAHKTKLVANLKKARGAKAKKAKAA